MPDRPEPTDVDAALAELIAFLTLRPVSVAQEMRLTPVDQLPG